MSKRSIEERFWAKVDKSGECWIWTASLTARGYGQFMLSSDAGSKLAHRVAYELTVGPTTADLDHICHHPPCVNPAHLRPVTDKQNQEHRIGSNSNSRSQYRGVYRASDCNRWRAEVMHRRRRYYLGLFPTIAEANAAVIAKRNELFTHNDADRIAS